MSGEVIVFYKSMAELDREWHALLESYLAGHIKLGREYDLLKALQNGDADVLAKATEDELTSARSVAAQLDGIASAAIHYLTESEAFSKQFTARCNEHRRLRARSERFLRRIGAN